jgi:hypothetical protein
MSIAKLAWLTSPAPGRYILNFQIFGSEDLIQVEVGSDHMRNILSDGVPLMLRNSLNRVPINLNQESADGPAGPQQQRTA